MFPNELIILLAIALSGGSGMTLRTRPMLAASENEYVGYLYRSLVTRGFISENGSKGFKLTSKGSEALLTFLNKNQTKITEIIEALNVLGIESSYRIRELGKEAIGAK